MVECFWIGLISVSGSLGYIYGAPVGWLIFGGVLLALSLIAVFTGSNS